MFRTLRQEALYIYIHKALYSLTKLAVPYYDSDELRPGLDVRMTRRIVTTSFNRRRPACTKL
jgi:hypothetical protein